jgi:hypothetical protein
MSAEKFAKIENLLETTGTYWKANKIPLVANVDGQELHTETFGMFRSDNNAWLGSVGNQYTPMQNVTLAETIVDLADRFHNDVDKLKGGIFGDGQRVFYQLSLKDQEIGPDTLKRNITCLNSHNGSSSIGFGSTNTVISCSNTFHRAMKDLSKLRHTESADARLRLAVAEFQKAMDDDEMLMERFNRFTEVVLDKTILERVISNVFGVDGLNVKESQISTRKKNQISGFETALKKETTSKGGTLWGLFNAVTYYTNHMGNSKDTNQHLMYGSGYKKNLKAFNIIDQYENDKRALVFA